MTNPKIKLICRICRAWRLERSTPIVLWWCFNIMSGSWYGLLTGVSFLTIPGTRLCKVRLQRCVQRLMRTLLHVALSCLFCCKGTQRQPRLIGFTFFGFRPSSTKLHPPRPTHSHMPTSRSPFFRIRLVRIPPNSVKRLIVFAYFFAPFVGLFFFYSTSL